MEQKVLNNVVLSLGTAVILGLTGCSNSDNNGVVAGGGILPGTSTTTSGTASDGYIKDAIVCLDMNLNNQCDNNASYKEPFTVTDANGSYSLEVSAADKAKAAANAPLLLVGGTDIDTLATLSGTFKAPFDATAATTTAQITPLTTLVSAMVDKNVSVDTAYKQVAKALGLTETEVKSDPVKLAKDSNNTKVIQAAMTIHRVITTMAKSAGVNNSKIYGDLVTAINAVADSNASNTSIATIVTKAADEANSTLPRKAKDAAKVAGIIETTISEAITTYGSTNIQNAALASDDVVSTIQATVTTALDNNISIDSTFIANVDTNASDTLAMASPVKIAVKNLLSSYLSDGATLPDSDIDSIASHFTTSAAVSVEAIIALKGDSSIKPAIITDLETAYKEQGIKSYVLNLGYTISAGAIKHINLDNFSSTMTKEAFATMIYDTKNPELMTLALQINPPADIASMSDIQKAKNLFTSVRTQVNQADTFTKNESTKIDTALNSVSNSVTFTTTLFGTLNDMVGQAIDTNQTTASRLVGGGDRNITISKTTASNNVSWAYTIKDTNVTTSWDGTLTYTDVNPDNFNPADFTTLSAKLTGTTPIDTYGATIADGKTNSQDLDANVNINKIANGATLKLNATITNNGDSVSVTDANIKSIYDVNSTNNEPLVKYIELQNLYVNGTVGAYTLDGKLDIPSYAVNTIGAANGFDPKTTYYWFGIDAQCDNNSTLEVSNVKYDGISAKGYGHNSSSSNGTTTNYYWFNWNDMKSAPTDAGVASNYSGLVCSDNTTPTINWAQKDSWTDDDLQNSGHYPSEITFNGKLTNTVTSAYLNATVDAKWTNIVDANLSDENYKPNIDATITGELAMPESPVMNVTLKYNSTATNKTVKVTYVNSDVSITANTVFSDDNGTKTINLSSTTGIKSTIILNGDNTVDYTKSTVTDTNGKTVGTVVDLEGAPTVKYADGTFESLF